MQILIKLTYTLKSIWSAKYHFFIKKREDIRAKHFKDSKDFIEYSNVMDHIYKNTEEHNPNKKCKILIVFNDMIADMLNNKKPNPILTELFIRGGKLNKSLVFLAQSYFSLPKNVRLNFTHYFIIKIPNEQKLQRMALNNSSDIIDFNDFMNLYKTYTAKTYSFLVTDGTLASDNPLRFRKNHVERIQKLIIRTDDKIRDEKLQYNINRETAKRSALWSGKIDKYECLAGDEIEPPDQRRVIEQGKFAYSTSRKAFEKQTKTIEDQGEQ